MCSIYDEVPNHQSLFTLWQDALNAHPHPQAHAQAPYGFICGFHAVMRKAFRARATPPPWKLRSGDDPYPEAVSDAATVTMKLQPFR